MKCQKDKMMIGIDTHISACIFFLHSLFFFSLAMNTKIFVSGSVLFASLLLPLSTYAAEQRRNYSKYWSLTSEKENTVEIAKELPELENEVILANAKLEELSAEYRNLLDGMRYESAILQREREELENTSVQQLLTERDILGRFSIVGAPSNHLKIRARQWKLEDAQNILEEERVLAFQDLEKRERILARETEKIHREYLAKRESAQQRLDVASENVQANETALNYAETDKRNVFLNTITVVEKNEFLEPRRVAYKQLRALRAERLRHALERARQNKYLATVQPEVEEDLMREKENEEEDARKMFEKQLLESLGSDRSNKVLKIHFLEQFFKNFK